MLGSDLAYCYLGWNGDDVPSDCSGAGGDWFALAWRCKNLKAYSFELGTLGKVVSLLDCVVRGTGDALAAWYRLASVCLFMLGLYYYCKPFVVPVGLLV